MWIGKAIYNKFNALWIQPVTLSPKELRVKSLLESCSISDTFANMAPIDRNWVIEYIFARIKSQNLNHSKGIRKDLQTEYLNLEISEDFAELIALAIEEFNEHISHPENIQFNILDMMLSNIAMNYPDIFDKYYKNLSENTQTILQNFNCYAQMAKLNEYNSLEEICEDTKEILNPKHHSKNILYITIINHIAQITEEFKNYSNNTTVSKILGVRPLGSQEVKALEFTAALIEKLILECNYKSEINDAKVVIDMYLTMLSTCEIRFQQVEPLIEIICTIISKHSEKDPSIPQWIFQRLLPKEKLNIFAIQRLLVYQSSVKYSDQVECFAPHAQSIECSLTEETAINGYCTNNPMAKTRLNKEPSNMLEFLKYDSKLLDQESYEEDSNIFNSSSLMIERSLEHDEGSFIEELFPDHTEEEIVDMAGYKFISLILANYYQKQNAYSCRILEDNIMDGNHCIRLNFVKIRALIADQYINEFHAPKTTLSKLLSALDDEDPGLQHSEEIEATQYFSIHNNSSEFEIES